MKHTQLSRRDLLKLMGVGAAGVGALSLNPAMVLAQVTPGSQDVVAFYRFKIGSFDAMVINDANFNAPATVMGANADPAEVEEFFGSLGLLNGSQLTNIVQILVVDTGDDLIVFDTGFGPNAPNGGRLVPTLEAAGLSADDVTAVIISHFHGDHVGGISTGRNLNFPNAQLFYPQPEFDFMEATPNNSGVQSAMRQIQPAIDGGSINFYNDGDELVPGVRAVAAHGHTPGHMGLMIESGSNRLLNMVDTMINVYSGMQHPEWFMGFDSLPEMAVETRRSVLTRAMEEQIPVFGYHFPYPGIGFVASQGDAFNWIPAAY